MTSVESDNHIPSSLPNSITGEVANRITIKLIEILEGEFGDESQVLDIIKPLIPAVVEYGLKEGADAAEMLLVGLGQEDPYPHWKRLIEAADPETRIQLMEDTMQAAIRENIQKIQRDELRWKVLKTALQVTIGILGLLLV